jgi:hypothetical protein
VACGDERETTYCALMITLLDKGRFAGKAGEPLIFLLRHWWKEDGIKEDWLKAEAYD